MHLFININNRTQANANTNKKIKLSHLFGKYNIPKKSNKKTKSKNQIENYLIEMINISNDVDNEKYIDDIESITRVSRYYI